MVSDPRILYKYRHLKGKHRKRTRRILADSILHFAKPSSLDDPFDCWVQFERSLSRQQLKHKYHSLLRKKMPQLNRRQRRAKTKTDIKSKRARGLLPHMTESLQAKVEGTGVLSLSATNSNVLIWSHYAAGHSRPRE